MIEIEAALEPTTVVDKETQCTIAISTSCRKAFRAAWPEWSKVRNAILNRYIAEIYSNSKTTQNFTPKGANQGQVGQVRMVGSGRFIAVMLKSSNLIKILTVKGSAPTLPALPAELKSGAPGSQVPKPVPLPAIH